MLIIIDPTNYMVILGLVLWAAWFVYGCFAIWRRMR